MLVAFAYSDDVRFDGVPWLPRPGHAPSSSAVPNGDERRTTTASSCIMIAGTPVRMKRSTAGDRKSDVGVSSDFEAAKHGAQFH